MRINAGPGVPPTDLAAVDLLDPGLYANGDPHAIWHFMRAHEPVYRHHLRDGRSFVSVTRHEDVSVVLKDHRRFTSEQGTLLSILGSPDPAGGRMMAASDPPVHTMLREPLMRILSNSKLRSAQDGIRAVVRRLLAPLAEPGPYDLAAAATGFPMAFTGSLMGLPEDDWPRLAELTTMAIAPEDVRFAGEAGFGLVAAHHELFEYFADLISLGANRGDLIEFMTRMPVGTRTMRMDELVYNCYSLLLGANVTTPHAVAATVLALIEHPDQYRLWSAGGATTADVVEEGLRWSSPANHFMRYATADVELAGVPISAGEAVVAWLGSADRDERVFAKPYVFDVARTPNRHIAFGLGPHYCIGAPLARIALRLFFEEAIGLVEEFSLAGPVEHLGSSFTAGITSLPITARLRPGAAVELRRALDTVPPAPNWPTATVRSPDLKENAT